MSIAKSVSKPAKGIKAENRKAWWKRYRESLRYSLYVITHPFDGFWDLNREKKGSMAAAHTIFILFLLIKFFADILFVQCVIKCAQHGCLLPFCGLLAE